MGSSSSSPQGHHDRDQRPQQPDPKLLEVLQERHLVGVTSLAVCHVPPLAPPADYPRLSALAVEYAAGTFISPYQEPQDPGALCRRTSAPRRPAAPSHRPRVEHRRTPTRSRRRSRRSECPRRCRRRPSRSFLSTPSTVPRTCFGSPPGDSTSEPVKLRHRLPSHPRSSSL